MQKRTFEQPGNQENAGNINEAGLSQAERNAIIDAKTEWLRELMNRALEKLDSDFKSGLIPNEDIKKKYEDSLVKAGEEIASADERSENINETLSRLDEIGSRFKRLLNIKDDTETGRQNSGIKTSVSTGNEKVAEIKLPYDKTLGGGNGKRRNGSYKIGRGLFRRRTRNGSRNRGKISTPPAV